MQIGDSYTWTPAAFEGEASGSDSRDKRLRRTRSVTGRIVYIHPRRRYFLAEAKVGDAVIRECFPIKPTAK